MSTTVEDLSAITFAECQPFLPDFTEAKCVKVYDGEICYMGVYMYHYGARRFTCRLIGIHTPELRAKSRSEKVLAKIVREEVKRLILNRVVSVTINGADKYGRLLLRIRTPCVDDLSLHLIASGLAVAYEGGRKQNVDWDALLKNWMHYCSVNRCLSHENDDDDDVDAEDDYGR